MSFGRVVRLYAGKFFEGNGSVGDALDLSALDIDFEVTRAVTFYDNCATVTVHNASPSTVRRLSDDCNSLVLQAGYRDGAVGNIFVGQIACVETRRDGAGYATTVSCVSSRGAFYQLSRLHLSVSFDRGTRVRACLDTLCSYAGIALRAGFTEDMEKGIPWAFSASGTFRAVARQFTEFILWPYFKKRIYLDNNELIVTDGKNSVGLEDIVLDHSSGLLSATARRDESLNRVNFGDDPEYYLFSEKEGETAEEYRGRKPVETSGTIYRPREIEFRALVTPKIAPNVFVQVDSSTGSGYDSVTAVKGRFVVTRCVFRGSNAGGDFTVECEAREAEPLPVKEASGA